MARIPSGTLKQFREMKILCASVAGDLIIPTATVAAAGSTQSDATQIATGFTLVTGANNTKGVLLPAAEAGLVCIVKVDAGDDLKVWPASGDAINALGADNALTVVDDVCFMLIAYDATTWYTLPLLPS